MPVSRSPSFPPSGSPAYSPDDLPVYRGGESGGGPTPPVGCAITLTGDAAAAFPGASVPDIDGQRFSVTNASAGIYLASTAMPAEVRAMPAAGKKVWVQGGGFSASGVAGTNARAGFIGLDGVGAAVALIQIRSQGVAGEFSLYFESPVGTVVANVSLPNQAASYSLGIGADGKAYFYDRTAGLVKEAGAELNALYADAFAGVTGLVLLGSLDLTGGGPASAAGEFVTNQAEMTDRAALVGDEDWCQNTIS